MSFNDERLAKLAELTGKTPEEIYEKVCSQVLRGNTTLDTYTLEDVGCSSYTEAMDKIANGEELIVLDEYLEDCDLTEDDPERTIRVNVYLGVELDCDEEVSMLQYLAEAVLSDVLSTLYSLTEE